MLLTIQQNGAFIADGSLAGGSVVGDLSIDGEGMADVVRRIGADGPNVFDRTTIEHNVKFVVQRSHGSAEAAEGHRILVRQRTANVGPMTIERTTATGTIHRYAAAQAHWKMTRAPQDEGEGSVITYEVLCGVFVYSTDTGGETLGYIARDTLLQGGAGYGTRPGFLFFPAPWNGGVHDAIAVTSVTLAHMAA